MSPREFDQNPDVDLERRLRESLRDGLGGDPVRTDLVTGARRRAQAIRRRRSAAAAVTLSAGMAAAIALPQVLRPAQDSAAPPVPGPALSAPAAVTTTATAPDQPPEPAPYPVDVPSSESPAPEMLPAPESVPPTEPPTDRGDDAASLAGVGIEPEIPTSLLLQESDFPTRTVENMGAEENYRFMPTVSGQACGENRRSLAPSNASQQTMSSGGMSSVTLVITSWADPGSAMQQVLDQSGMCRFIDPVSLSEGTDGAGRQSITGGFTANDLNQGVSVTRVGRFLVAVTTTERTRDATLEEVTAESARVGALVAERAAGIE